MTTSDNVPNPGLCRSGIHKANTATLEAITTEPSVQPVVREMP